MKKTIRLIAVLFMVSFVVAQDFELEEVEKDGGGDEEEYVEEEILIEDRAGTTPDNPFYFVDEVIEDVNFAVKDGEKKAEYALEVNEEKVAEAKLMADKNKSSETERALLRANNISGIIEQEVSPELESETKEKMEFIKKILGEMEEQIPEDWDAIESLIDSQQSQAEKNKIAANLATKIGDLCEKLAMEDYSLMEAEPRCDPDNAPEWLKEFIEDEINEREEEAKRMLIDQITTCINDPRDCDCGTIPVRSHQLECEESTALAIECEFEQNMRACNELDKRGPPSSEGMPHFLRGIFEETFTELIAKKEKEMFEKFAPKECIDAGATTREECERIMTEIHGPPPEECMEDGVFIGEDECMAIMIESGIIPEECIEDGKPIPKQECMEKMVPEPCKEAGAFTEEECRAIMEEFMRTEGGKGMGPPEECIADGEFIGEEECQGIMMEKGMSMGPPGGMPVEGTGPPEGCMVDGEFIGEEECNEIMAGRFGMPGENMGPPRDGAGMGPPGGIRGAGVIIPQYPEGVQQGGVLVIGEEGAETISREDLEDIKNKAKERAEQGIEIPDEVRELSDDIVNLERAKSGEIPEEIEEAGEEEIYEEGAEEPGEEMEGEFEEEFDEESAEG